MAIPTYLIGEINDDRDEKHFIYYSFSTLILIEILILMTFSFEFYNP